MSHLGRPDGQPNSKYSLKQIVPEVEKTLGTKVAFADDCVGPQAEELVNKTSGGGVVLLENLRFHVEEEGKGVDAQGQKVKASESDVKKFREGLTRLGDVYISMCPAALPRSCRRSARRRTAYTTQTTPSAPRTAPTAAWWACRCRSAPPATS